MRQFIVALLNLETTVLLCSQTCFLVLRYHTMKIIKRKIERGYRMVRAFTALFHLPKIMHFLGLGTALFRFSSIQLESRSHL
jgi:Na+/alanine symporter